MRSFGKVARLSLIKRRNSKNLIVRTVRNTTGSAGRPGQLKPINAVSDQSSVFKSGTALIGALTLSALIAGCGTGGPGSNVGATGGSGGGASSGVTNGLPAGGSDSPGSTPPPSGGDTDVVPGGGFGDGGSGGGSGGNAGGGGGGTTTNSTSVTVPSSNSISRATSTVTSNLGGNFLALNINIANANAFQIVSEAGSSALSTAFLTDPSGNQVLDPTDFRKTSGVCTMKTVDNCLDLGVNVIPFRAAPGDPSVVDGTYQQTLFSLGSTVQTTIIAKNDPDFSSGVLRVNIFLVGNDAQDQDFKNTVLPTALNIWKASYGTRGITISEEIFDVNSNFGVLPIPLAPSSLYANATSQGGVQPFAVNVFIGTSISENASESPGNELDGVLGIAAALPGAGIVTGRSAVAVSLNGHTGASGLFDSQDKITIFGETLAHESGHYLGLFHPVETDFETFDILSDTAECTSPTDCFNRGLVTNVMFPFPVENAGDPHIPQQDLSAQQGQVLNMQAIVD